MQKRGTKIKLSSSSNSGNALGSINNIKQRPLERSFNKLITHTHKLVYTPT